eukprot:TRINITY_DN29381_c0_g1_i1.p1 TRINITY_DN29381_c0_g1~~TRINITY_DN29381_c0_g1_i1.p1  ORF type:complete len:201 (+),score=13.48 TRINITY_DN29381_c0_g1_i1:99-701(+)
MTTSSPLSPTRPLDMPGFFIEPVISGSVDLPIDADAADPLEGLPHELVLSVFSFLDAPALCAAMQVNKHWYALARDGGLWQAAFLRRRWQPPPPGEVVHASAELRPPSRRGTQLQLTWLEHYRRRSRLMHAWNTDSYHERELASFLCPSLLQFVGERLLLAAYLASSRCRAPAWPPSATWVPRPDRRRRCSRSTPGCPTP